MLKHDRLTVLTGLKARSIISNLVADASNEFSTLNASETARFRWGEGRVPLASHEQDLKQLL